MRCLALFAALLLLLACSSPTQAALDASPDATADQSAQLPSAALFPSPSANSDKDSVDKQKAQQKWNIEHGLGVPSTLPVSDPHSSPLPVVPPVAHSTPLALSPVTKPIPEQIFGVAPQRMLPLGSPLASREEESEQEDQSESPSSVGPVVIVIQPKVAIHMPEGSVPMQRPEQSESEADSEFEQRPEQSTQQPDRESEKGEEEQMDRPPSSLAAPISLRQSAIKVALMRRKVVMLESKLAAMRSKLAGDSSLALPIARARRQLMRAKLALAIVERRHRLLRHQKLKEHEAKLMTPDELKLKHGQTDETTHFDTQAFDQQQLVSIPTFARVAAPVSVSVPVPVLSAPLSSAAPAVIEPSTPLAIPTYARVQAPILSVAQPIVQPAQPTFTTTIIQPTIQPTIQPALSVAQPVTQPITQSALINVPIVRPIPPVALSYTPSTTVSVLSEPQPQPTAVQIAQPASFALPAVQLQPSFALPAAQQPQMISTVQPVLSYAQPQLQQPFAVQPTMQPESSLTAVPSVSQAVGVPGPFQYLGPQAPLQPIGQPQQMAA